MAERRFGSRIPLQIFLNEYVGERLHRCLSNNVSETGLFLHKLVTPPERRGGVVQLEFELPGTNEIIWACGQVAYQRIHENFHQTGVHLTGIPRLHARLLRDYVRSERVRHLSELLDRIRHAADRTAQNDSLHFNAPR